MVAEGGRVDDGLRIDDLEHTSQAEIDTYLMRMWRHRGSLYELSANSVWLDTRPDFAKLHRWGAALFGRPQPANILLLGLGNLHAYIHLGWETGILNQFRLMQRHGVTRAQLMEVVMAAQISAGVRGLQHVYNAVGTLLPDFQDRPIRAPFPDGWVADPAAFRCSLDLTTAELTAADLAGLTSWYERTLGYVPHSVLFAAEHHPRFLKAHRSKWEAAFRTLPKQVMPYLMLRHATTTGAREGMREAALLGKAWGMGKHWAIKAMTAAAFYFTGLEMLDLAYDAVYDVLDTWPDES